MTDGQTDGWTVGENWSGYYSGLHCEQCGRAVKMNLNTCKRRHDHNKYAADASDDVVIGDTA